MYPHICQACPGEEQALGTRLIKSLKKLGNAEFRAAVLVYKTKCAGHGRGYSRPSFDWARYYMAVKVASSMQQGSKALWMKQGQFIRWLMDSESVTYSEAAIEWEKRLNDKTVSQESGPDGVKILVKVEQRYAFSLVCVPMASMLRSPVCRCIYF